MPHLDLQFLGSLLSIICIDLVLAGDNAVVIAMASNSLAKKQRLLSIGIGAGAAVIMRVVLTVFAAKLMGLPYIKLVGGILIAWIGVKLLVQGSPDEDGHKQCSTLTQAVFTVIVADLVMSTDNILAVAGASKGDIVLLLIGLGLSIPFVVFTSSILSNLMDRFPWILMLGSAILGKVAVEMVLTDQFTLSFFLPTHAQVIVAEIVGAAGVVVVGKLYPRLQGQRATRG